MSKIRSLKAQLLSRSWSSLQKFTYEFLLPNGSWEEHVREVYDRGNGACALLYNSTKEAVILIRQFRLPTYLNGNETGFLIEACAGKLNQGENPEEAIRREIEEETGHRVKQIEKVFESYMSPGSVTEVISMYLASYDESTYIHSGGGLAEEGENIEVLELPLNQALEWMHSGKIKDAKTIMLLQFLALRSSQSVDK